MPNPVPACLFISRHDSSHRHGGGADGSLAVSQRVHHEPDHQQSVEEEDEEHLNCPGLRGRPANSQTVPLQSLSGNSAFDAPSRIATLTVQRAWGNAVARATAVADARAFVDKGYPKRHCERQHTLSLT